MKLYTPNMGRRLTLYSAVVIGLLSLCSHSAMAQGPARVSARMDTRQITVGDQARLFIEVQNEPSAGRVQWATIPDTFNTLEIVERGKIDTQKQGNAVIYKQRLLITGFDSGVFQVPSFVFAIIPSSGDPYTVQTDSFQLLVQTVAVDTSKGFKGIKGIIYVKSTWMDYILYIIAGVVFLALFAFIIIYFMRHKKVAPPLPAAPEETLQQRTLRLLNELDAQELWQKQQVKEYYVALTDIVRNYIEERFQTPAMELTTDELLYKARMHRELQPYHGILSVVLNTADLAKFAKAQPLPEEHIGAMDHARQLVNASKPKPQVPIKDSDWHDNPTKRNTEATPKNAPDNNITDNPTGKTI